MTGNFPAMLLALTLPFAASRAAEPERFVICYSASPAAEEFAPYSRAVLDSDHHPPLAPLKSRGIQLFGYISLGEADTARPYYQAAAPFLLGANQNWPDARYVDLRQPAWHALILDRLIPDLLAQGFDGLFLDTLDDAAVLEHDDPVRHHGMVEAAAALIQEIHRRFPATPLMLNRAYDIGLHVADALESVLAESLTSTYDFQTRRYHLRNKADLEWGLARAAELRERNPRLRLYSLEYWEPGDRSGVALLYDRDRRAGFVPYVATVDLQQIVPEPPRSNRRSAR